jgi:hypothetical protein
VIDRSLIFNACFAGHGFTPLLPSAHLQASRKFSILKLTPVPDTLHLHTQRALCGP